MKLPPFPCLGGNGGDCEDEREGAIVGSEASTEHAVVNREGRVMESGPGEGTNEDVPEEGVTELEGAVFEETDGGGGGAVFSIGEEERGGDREMAEEETSYSSLGMGLLRVG